MLFSGAGTKIGVHPGRKSVSVSRTAWKGSKIKKASTAFLSLESDSILSLKSGGYRVDTVPLESCFLKMIDMGLLEHGNVVSLAIDDILVRTLVIDVEDMPVDRGEAEEFLKWKLARHTYAGTSNWKVDYMAVNVSNAKNGIGAGNAGNTSSRVLVSAVESHIVDCYEEVVYGAGLACSRIVPASTQLFNLFHDIIVADGDSYLVIYTGSSHLLYAVRSGVVGFARKMSISGDDFYSSIKTSMMIDSGQAGTEVERITWIGCSMPDGIAGELGVRCDTIPYSEILSVLNVHWKIDADQQDAEENIDLNRLIAIAATA